jgi:hypothetical protein
MSSFRLKSAREQMHRSIALLVLAAQLAAFLHTSLVRHDVCEHGQLVESSGDVGLRPSKVSESQVAVGSESGTSTQIAEEHEHCALPALLRTPSLRTNGVSIEATVEPSAPAPEPALVVANSQQPLVRAPKQSPPV